MKLMLLLRIVEGYIEPDGEYKKISVNNWMDESEDLKSRSNNNTDLLKIEPEY